MDVNYKFSHLFGTIYRNGNVLFSPDGNTVISPVGNKISVFDLKNNVSRTIQIESIFNITCMAINKAGTHMLVANERGHILYVNMLTETTVHRFRANRTVNAMSFSLKQVAITRGGDIQIHNIMSTDKNVFTPLQYSLRYKLSTENLSTVEWSSDYRLLVAGGEDQVVRVMGARALCNLYIATISGHQSGIVCAQFVDGSYDVVSVDRRGFAKYWQSNLKDTDLIYGKFDVENKDVSLLKYKRLTGTNVCETGEGRSFSVSSANIHASTKILVTAFDNGIFVLHELPSFSLIHSLRVSHQSVRSVMMSPSGDWLALACGKGSQGQLVVWEWQSETYVMKQQSHQLSIKSAEFSPDGSLIATAGEDGKVKVWNCRTSFCIVTFDEHTAAATSIAWTQSGKALLSSSLDGTVRARDLKRYRNFRTLVCPEPTPLGPLKVDASGDIVVSAAVEMFQIFVWSLENGQLLDVLSGHTSNISSLALKGNTLTSVSWDKTLRLWNIVDSSSETIDLTGEGVAVAVAPTLPILAVLSLEGTISFFDSSSLAQTGSIDVRLDVDSARLHHEKIKKQTSGKSKTFTSIAFSPNSSLLLAGGQSNKFYLYSVEDFIPIRRFVMTTNRSLDGVQFDMNRRNISEFGNMQLVETSDSEQELDSKKMIKLPGTKNLDKGERRSRPESEVYHLAFCPTGRRFCVSSTEGVQMYSLDSAAAFDPFHLEQMSSVAEVEKLLGDEEWSKAIRGALQLGEVDLIRKCVEGTPSQNIALLSSSLSLEYTERLLKWFSDSRGMTNTSRLQLYLTWLHNLLTVQGNNLKKKGNISLLTAVQQTIQHFSSLLSNLAVHNEFSIEYLLMARKMRDKRSSEVK